MYEVFLYTEFYMNERSGIFSPRIHKERKNVRMATMETANVGRAVAARVGSNIREVRTKLGLTQAQLASPEFSISYISAIERGKIRPSLKALSILAKRLDVPLTFLLEGSPAGAAEARAVGYSPADSGPDQRIDVDLLQASVLVQQQQYLEAAEVLAPMQPERITTDQVYRLFLLRGQIHLGLHENQEAVVDLRAAVTQGESLNDLEYIERARNLLGKAYFLLYNYTLALENHLRCNTTIEQDIEDDVSASVCHTSLAELLLKRGNADEAEQEAQKALTFANASQDVQTRGQALMALGQIRHNAKDYDGADKLFTEALDLLDASDAHEIAASAYSRYANLLEERGEVQRSLTAFKKAFEHQRQGNRGHVE